MALEHTDLAYSQWASLNEVLNANRSITVDGQTLSLTDVIAVCNYGATPALTDDEVIINAINRSVAVLNDKIQLGLTIYGVNTGFGGSADVRTSNTGALQKGLVQHLNVGILLLSDKGLDSTEENNLRAQTWKPHALPDSIVRGMLLIRCNSLMRGHSGVRLEVIRGILALLERQATPVVPLRGSISASGDLSPLSYIAGTLEGNPDIYVKLGGKHSRILTADKALKLVGLEPIQLQAKEALGITNGTATSTAAASIAMHQAHQLAVLVQLLTAMATEALLGTASNYASFISECRPHAGQKEAAANILAFLSDSKLAPSHDPRCIGLAQDRYALRTSPQWIGPLLENLLLADRQIQVEINSTTDNPLIDIASNTIHHGGNFQAAAVTSAMEKVTSSMQLLGKLMFAQCSELLDSSLSRSLPPNLAVDDPSKSFTMKGFDVNMAAYMSELAYLAHPISNHVQSAEMHNQSVNSLALVSARIALESIEILSLMAATYIYALCQALDLRCLQIEFEKTAEHAVRQIVLECFGHLGSSCLPETIHTEIWPMLRLKWLSLSNLDLKDRGISSARETSSALLQALARQSHSDPNSTASNIFDAIETYCTRVGEELSMLYSQKRSTFFKKQTTPAYISSSSKLIYAFVREDLDIPMHRGLADHPSSARSGDTRSHKILGTMASDIYVALRNGNLYNRIMQVCDTRNRSLME